MNGTVRALFVKLEKGAKSVPRDSVQAGLGGFDGDHHTENSKRRQILLISGSVIDQLHLQPGNVYENVVVDGLDVMTLREGQRLRLGDALVARGFAESTWNVRDRSGTRNRSSRRCRVRGVRRRKFAQTVMFCVCR